MDIISIIVLSVGSLAVLFVLTKLMGYRQMSEMSMFDYINGITIGSIAAEMATSLEKEWWLPLTAMVVYALVTILLSFIGVKSILGRRIISGKSMILMDHGTIFEKNLKKGKIDLAELLVQCRVNGYFDLSDLQTIILEPNGRISFLPKADKRPVNPGDLQLTPQPDYLVANVIIDGHVMDENLRHTGKDRSWLFKQMNASHIRDVREVLLATCDMQNTITFYPKTHQEMNRDILD